MKRNILTLLILVVFILSGCEGFLEKQPLDEISTSTFWLSKSDFEMALTANYGYMHGSNAGPWDNPPAGMWGYCLPVWDNLTDNSYGQHDYGGTKAIVAGDITSNTGGYITGVYDFTYKAIARVNLFLDQLSKYEGTDISEEEKSIAEAEVRFLRAFYYFQLYSLYGDVPLVVEPLNLETQYQAKATAADVVSQVLTDLDFGIANLEDKPYYENTGHVVKSTAQALKARVLMYTAYGTNGTPDIATLITARDLCMEVMSEYTLSEKFTDLFQDAGQSGNKEIIFAVNYLAPDNVPSWGADLIYGDWISCSPLQNFVDDFECTDGLPWGESPLTDTENPFNDRDPRLSATVFNDSVVWGEGNVHHPSNSRPTGYGLKKVLDPSNVPYDYAALSQQNAVVIRLGEVLLMYAEAQNEIAGPDASVYQAATDLRARVDMPSYPAGLSQADMRERIRHERRIELAFEGLRYYDLRRWHIAGDVLNTVTDGLIGYNWDDKFYHWPLPQSEIDKSNGVLIQNPDYN